MTPQANSQKNNATNGCGEIIYSYDYTVNGQSYVWKYTYTVTPEDFTLPANGGTTIACARELAEPSLLEVKDACDNVLQPIGDPLISTTPDCNGTVTYVYTYKDCADRSHDWTYTYTIAKPKLTIPADGGSDVACLKDVKDPTAEDLEDNCGRTVTAVQDGDRIENIGTDGNGTVTYNFTYTDCTGATYPWKYVYNVKAEEFTAPIDGSSTVNCVKEAVTPTLPTIVVCGQDV